MTRSGWRLGWGRQPSHSRKNNLKLVSSDKTNLLFGFFLPSKKPKMSPGHVNSEAIIFCWGKIKMQRKLWGVEVFFFPLQVQNFGMKCTITPRPLTRVKQDQSNCTFIDVFVVFDCYISYRFMHLLILWVCLLHFGRRCSLQIKQFGVISVIQVSATPQHIF